MKYLFGAIRTRRWIVSVVLSALVSPLSNAEEARPVQMNLSLEPGLIPQDDHEEQKKDDTWLLSKKNVEVPKFILGGGFVYSRWQKFNSDLRNGALNLDIGFSRELIPALEAGLSFHFLSAISNSSNQENIFATTVSADAQFYFIPGKLRPFAGMSLAVGAYRVWALAAESKTAISFRKYASGAIFGAVPKIGINYMTSALSSVELCFSYWAFFDNPSYKVGGPAVGLNFVFSR